MRGAFVTVKMAAMYFNCTTQTARIKLREIAAFYNLRKPYNGKLILNIKAVNYLMFCEYHSITKEFLEEVVDKRKI